MAEDKRPAEQVTIPLTRGGTYTLSISPDDLAGLATGILTHLRCSFEILYPQNPADREQRQQDRKRIMEQLREAALEYAGPRRGYGNLTPEEVEAKLADAFKEGWAYSPKPVTYPIR